MRTGLTLSILLALVGAAMHVEAQELPVRLESYAAPPSCPNEDGFHAEVVRARRVVPRPRHVSLAVGIGPDGEGYRGHVAITPDEGEASVRVVRAPTCEQVVSALALISALAIDDAPAAAPPAPAPLPSPRLDLESTRSRSDGTSTPIRTAALELAAGLHAGMEGGVAPKPLFSLPVFVELRLHRPPDDDRFRVQALFALRVGFVTAAGSSVVGQRTSADFRFTAGKVDVCPIRLAAGGASLAPCPAVELGVIAGEGKNIEPAQSEHRFWAAAAFPIRFRYDVGNLFVELAGGPRIPFVRDRFVVLPETEIFRAPSVGWMGSIGAGIAFR